MRIVSLSVTGLIVLWLMTMHLGCDKSSTSYHQDYEMALTLTDLHGRPRDTVRSGEDFYLTLVVANHTGTMQYYSYSPPGIGFQIHAEDSLLMTSWEGHTYPDVLLDDSLGVDSSESGTWQAPRSPSRPTFMLSAGVYRARGIAGLEWNNRGYLSPVDKTFYVIP